MCATVDDIENGGDSLRKGWGSIRLRKNGSRVGSGGRCSNAARRASAAGGGRRLLPRDEPRAQPRGGLPQGRGPRLFPGTASAVPGAVRGAAVPLLPDEQPLPPPGAGGRSARAVALDGGPVTLLRALPSPPHGLRGPSMA